MAHLLRKQFLLLQRLVKPLFGSEHVDSNADERRKFGHHPRVPAVEMPFVLGHDPERSQRQPVGDIQWHEQN